MYEITQRTQAPYRAVCYIVCTWSDGSRTSASGVVVGVNDVLTAMHVVYDTSRGGWAQQISISPAADTAPSLVQPLGVYTDWGRISTRTGNWDQDGDGLLTTAEAQWDLAVIGMQSRIGDVTGWVGSADTANSLSGLMVGYPSRGTGMMAEQVFATASTRYGVFEVQSILGPGASGGPLLQTQADGSTYAVGVLSAGSVAGNHSTYAGLYGSGTWDWFTQALVSNDDLLSGTASMLDDYAASVQTTARLSLGMAVAARLEQLGDVDWFRVELAAGVYRFEALGVSTGQGTLGDPVVALRAADGTPLAQDDDSGTGLNARLEYTVVQPGSYYVAVSAPASSPAGTTGTYQVQATLVTGALAQGTPGPDTAPSSTRDDWFQAGAGADRWVLHGVRADYTVAQVTGTQWTTSDTVAGRDGRDTLVEVERLVFADRVLALDLGMNEPAGRASLLLGVALGPQALHNAALVGALVGYFDGGASLQQGAQLLVDSGVLAQLAGGADNASFVRLVYRNAVGEWPSAQTQAALAQYLDAGLFSQADMFRAVAELPVNQQHIDLVGLQASGLEYTV